MGSYTNVTGAALTYQATSLAFTSTYYYRFAVSNALEEIWSGIAACDKYIVETAPFKLWKNESERPRVGVILHVLCDALRHTARMVRPFMPETAVRITELLGYDGGALADAPGEWGRTFPRDHVVQRPQPLFPRIEVEP